MEDSDTIVQAVIREPIVVTNTSESTEVKLETPKKEVKQRVKKVKKEETNIEGQSVEETPRKQKYSSVKHIMQSHGIVKEDWARLGIPTARLEEMINSNGPVVLNYIEIDNLSAVLNIDKNDLIPHGAVQK